MRKANDNADIDAKRSQSGENQFERATLYYSLVARYIIRRRGGIAAFVSTRSPTKCGTDVRKTVTRDHARQISPRMCR